MNWEEMIRLLTSALGSFPWPQIITALAGLGGVAVGAFLAARNQRQQRQADRHRQQLDEFYGPLWSMRQYIEARSKLRQEISERGEGWWVGLFEGIHDPEAKQRISERHKGEVQSRIDYNNRELRELLLPKYREMLVHLGTHISLAEPTTRSHYPALVQFVALWDRFLEDGVPRDVLEGMQADGIAQEEALKPLYEDLRAQVERLSSLVTKP